MTKAELKTVTGFDTWLELYEFLKENGNDNLEMVHVRPPVHKTNPDKPVQFTLRVNDIKALALDEVYPRLPLAKSVYVIQENLGTILTSCISCKQESEQVYSFLNNLQTRKP